MVTKPAALSTRLATSTEDIKAAQRLRYDVFVEELGSDGPMVDHDARLETDRFDPFCEHLLLFDGDEVVGVYRLMTAAHAAKAGQFYCADEYDLTHLINSGRRLLELGRSCVRPAYRGGSAVLVLWQALADYVAANDIDILFGVASFHGTDVDALAPQLSFLHAAHLAPPELRVRSLKYQPLDILPAEQVDRPTAIRGMPALIKAYLRLGGVIGDGAYVDPTFNTTDVMLILDTDALSAHGSARYSR